MPTMYDMLEQLQRAAQPRPDLITPGSTGMLENARPYTYAGRVGTQRQPITTEMLSRPAVDVPEEGWGLPGATVMAGAGVVPFAQLPPWLRAKLPESYTKSVPGFMQHLNEAERMAARGEMLVSDVTDAMSRNPLNPLDALKARFPKATDEQLAAMVMASSLHGGYSGQQLKSGFYGKPQQLYHGDIERVLQPEKLAELKGWAHARLRESAERAAAQRSGQKYWSPLDWEGSNYPKLEPEASKAIQTPGTSLFEIFRKGK